MNRSTRLVALLVAAALLPAACARPPGASGPLAGATPRATSALWADPPSPTPVPASFAPAATPRTFEPIPSGLPAKIVAAIEWRRAMGLRDDPDWILEVARDPAASESWEHPITAAEEQFIWDRQERLRGFVAGVQRYAADHADEFGGLYMDNGNSAVATLWTGNLEAHRTALLAQLGGDAPIEVLPARWSERALRDLQDRASRDADWYADVGARGTGWGADLARNVVTIEISSANPDAPRLIAERIAATNGVPEEMLSVTSDGTGVELLASGTVKGVVTLADGSKPGVNNLSVGGRPDTIGSCGGGDLGHGVEASGRFEIPCKVGSYTIVILSAGGKDGEGEDRVVGQAAVEVRANEVSKVRIKLMPGVDVRG